MRHERHHAPHLARPLAVGVLLGAACSSGPDVATTRRGEPLPCNDPVETQYLVTGIERGVDGADAVRLGVDVGGDGYGSRDNRLGAAIAIFRSYGVPFADRLRSAGDVPLDWRIHIWSCPGDPTHHVTMSRAGVVRTVPSVGEFVDDVLRAREGDAELPLEALVGGDLAARDGWRAATSFSTEIRILANGDLEGQLGFALGSQARNGLEDVLWRVLEATMAADPACPDACATAVGAEVTELIDEDRDGITRDELFANWFVAGLLEDDLDLVAVPDRSVETDHLSYGFAFEATRLDP